MRKGRPSKYNPRYCKVVIDLMSEGLSKEVVAAELGISRDTLYEWCRKNPDFSDTIKRGELLSQRYWERIGIDGMLGRIPGFKVAIWIFMMKTRFGWNENQVIPEVANNKIGYDPDQEYDRIMTELDKSPIRKSILLSFAK